MLQSISLSAGATLIPERRQGSPSFAISIWFPFGSRNEAPAARGFVHFIEHMLFKGTSRHDAFSLWRSIERTGGYANGFTDRDGVCLFSCVPSSEWLLALELIAEAAFTSIFSLQEFEREKRVILSEIRQIEDDVEETAFDAFLQRFWLDHPAAKPIAGQVAEVEAIDRDLLYDFYKHTFNPANALIVTSGDVDSALLTAALDTSIIRTAPEIPPATLIHPPAPAAKSFQGYTKARSSQVYSYEAIQLDTPYSMKDFFGLSVISGILGEASTSRLFQKVREELGLAYTVQSSLSFSKTEALLVIQAVTGNGSLNRCLCAIDAEIRSFFARGISPDELDEAKSRLAGSFILSLEDPESRMRRIAAWAAIEGRVPEIEAERAMYLDVSMEEVTRLMERLAVSPYGRYAYGSVTSAVARSLSLVEA
ncbi:MAG: hypothetical protein CVV53_05275 [Spirochaetae bacterium HGW-Spirochaetae-9]|nr:MAG: hypothetical protein CVV53_05275 [Spirochaetae bacterium HGW-Spirochaetae-9]